MKVASRSGFFVFLGGIFAARNVVNVRAAFTLQPPLVANFFTDLIPAITTTLIAPQVHVGELSPWLPGMQDIELKDRK